ncbi:hypothetical protein [Kutzneria buriramensis]|uniref:Uncharacterized protein n=1 Tax=Kutzneria buriramensis TaxID=1045776 RepID=A0A3E0H7J8_9PSEU|nr:hypothetical protein [Kutzneria buriramensis]REH39247.1 hypothetical protein BCF44_113102 [Kutzneria buriramensis]
MTEERGPARTALELVGLVIAPATVITSVLLYFGWNRENAFFGYFGLDPGVLKLSAQDLLLRSVGVVFLPAVIVLACLAALILLGRLGSRFASRLRVVRCALLAIAVAGAVLALTGVIDPLWGAASLAASALLGADLVSTTTRLWGQALVGSVIAVALFWSAAVYSGRTGVALASYINANPAGQPAVTVDSTTRIDFPPALVTETRIPAEDGKFHYEYTGLRMLIYSNDRWVLILGRRPGQSRVTISVLRDSDSIRVEVTEGR